MLLLAAVGVSGAQGRQGAPTTVAITHVAVVDVERGRSIADQTVVVRGARIAAVGPSAGRGAVGVPAGVRMVDGRGKFLIPGLWDMHVHFMNTGVSALPQLVANGVTSVREMGGYIDSTRAWQRRMAAGALVGPRIKTPGPVLESPQYLARVRERDARMGGRLAPFILPYRIGVGDSSEARRAVDSLAALRVDFVKVRNTGSPAAYLAVLAEARRVGLAVAGHLPAGVTLAEASAAGQKSVEHLILPSLASLPDSARRAVYVAVARRGTWYTPTLVVTQPERERTDAQMRVELDDSTGVHLLRRYAAPSLVSWWRFRLDERAEDTTTARRDSALRVAYRSGLADVRGLRDAGVPILAGTDAGSLLTYPGWSLHEELTLLVNDAGLTPREALWAATLGPARYFGMERELGTVAAGKLADLVLLTADPLANIHNTRMIAAVVANGRYFDRAAIGELLR